MASITVLAAMLAGHGVRAAEAPRLGFPLDCEIGVTCFVQQYVDVLEGPEVRDYACGNATYDGHDGTDIRLRSTADVNDGVAVRAAADGVVLGFRDGVPDRLARTAEDRRKVDSIACGNGVVLDHGAGWQTQYCHMKQGSVAVRKGDRVSAGGRLGAVGYSGAAAFPHLHLTVRHGGKTIDPFRGPGGGQQPACGPGKQPLWTADALAGLAYRPTRIIDAGFADGPVEMAALEHGTLAPADPARRPGALVGWGWAINLEKGDELAVVLSGPDGRIARKIQAVPRHRAQQMLFAGRKTPPGGWPAGTYEVRVEVSRNGSPVLQAERRLIVP